MERASRISLTKEKVIETNRIYVKRKDGTLETRRWTGYYSKGIASAVPLCFGARYEHIEFNKKDGVPIVKEIPFSELVRRN